MLPQQHLCNGLARPVDYSIFAREWIRPTAGESCWHMNGFPNGQHALLAYGTLAVRAAIHVPTGLACSRANPFPCKKWNSPYGQ